MCNIPLLWPGHHTAAPVWSHDGVPDWEVCPASYPLCSLHVWGAHVLLWCQDQQWEHDQVPSESEGDVPRPEEQGRVLCQWSRVPGLQCAAKSQQGRHPKVNFQFRSWPKLSGNGKQGVNREELSGLAVAVSAALSLVRNAGMTVRNLGWAQSLDLSHWEQDGCTLTPAHLKLLQILPENDFSLSTRGNEEGMGPMSRIGEWTRTAMPRCPIRAVGDLPLWPSFSVWLKSSFYQIFFYGIFCQINLKIL